MSDFCALGLQKAIETENGKEFMEHVITVEWAFSKSEAHPITSRFFCVFLGHTVPLALYLIDIATQLLY
jgi:RNA recognition motif-containing protein